VYKFSSHTLKNSACTIKSLTKIKAQPNSQLVSVSGERGGAHGVKPTPNPKACRHAKGVEKTKQSQLTQNPIITRLEGEERERSRTQDFENSSTNLCPIFTRKPLTFPWFQNPARSSEGINSIWSKNQRQTTPIWGARTTVQKALVVSPIFSSISHLLTSKFLHKLPLDVS